MAQPSNTQPDPQVTIANGDAEMLEQSVNAENSKNNAPNATKDETSPVAKPPASPTEGEATSQPSAPAAVGEAPERASSTLPDATSAQADASTLSNASDPAEVAPPTKPDEPAKKAEPSFLYVEDDPFSREVITRLIKQNMGLPNLTVFEDSSDFMARVKKLPAVPDVFLLDIQISPLNGHQMLKLLRDDETFKQSKIIALTASVMASEVKQLQDAGFDGLIGKPVMKRVFPELLQKVLDGEAVWYVS